MSTRIVFLTCYRYITKLWCHHSLTSEFPRRDLHSARGILENRVRSWTHFSGTKITQVGEAIPSIRNIADSSPLAGSIWKTWMLLESWFAANSHLPVGSIAKLRGIFPPVEIRCTKVRVPSAGLMRNTSISLVLSPRFET